MGLDMYLTAKEYVSGWKHNTPSETEKYNKLLELMDLRDLAAEESPSAYIEITVGYWRKANQIHNWFVQHIQDGEDDCNDYYVSTEQLKELRSLCLRVLAETETMDGLIWNGQTYTKETGWVDNWQEGKTLTVEATKIAEELLPATSGFFFGSTQYDEWYLDDLKRTVEIIDKIEPHFDKYDFYYRSSW